MSVGEIVITSVLGVLATMFTFYLMRGQGGRDKKKDAGKEILERLITGMDAMMDAIIVIYKAVKNKKVNGDMDDTIKKVQDAQKALNGSVVDKATI